MMRCEPGVASLFIYQLACGSDALSNDYDYRNTHNLFWAEFDLRRGMVARA